jgi:Bacterial Ig domain
MAAAAGCRFAGSVRLIPLLLAITFAGLILPPTAGASASCDLPQGPVPVRTSASATQPVSVVGLLPPSCAWYSSTTATDGFAWTQSTSWMPGYMAVLYRPSAAPPSTVTVTLESMPGMGGPMIGLALSPTANRPPICRPLNQPMLDLAERAPIEIGCYDPDGDPLTPSGGTVQFNGASPPAEPWSLWRFTGTFAPAGEIGAAATTVHADFTIGDGFATTASGTAFPVAAAGEQLPLCHPVAVDTGAATAVVLQLPCGDPDAGDAYRIAVRSGPAQGKLGPVAPDGSVMYTPAAGWAGKDTFTYVASDGRGTSVPATATVTTAPPAVAPPAATPRVSATVANSWTMYKRHIRVRRLVVRDAPVGAIVELRCRGKGCGAKRMLLDRGKDGAFRATKRLRGRRLKRGAIVEIRVIAPGSIGKVVRYRIDPPKTPKGRTLCLPPGASKPGPC